MKNTFLSMALEEVGLVQPTEVADVDTDADIDKLLEQQEADVDAFVDASAEINTVAEVKEGLESLVASMEAALVDPNYSPREYRLQVNHAQALLARIGCGVGGALSCESTDGANDAKESFSEKAKKLGAVLMAYIRKFFAWIREKGKEMANRISVIGNRVKDRTGLGWKEGNEYKITGLWEEAEFDPAYPNDYIDYVSETWESYKKLVEKTIKEMKTQNGGTLAPEDLAEYRLAVSDICKHAGLAYGIESPVGGVRWFPDNNKGSQEGVTKARIDFVGNTKKAEKLIESFVDWTKKAESMVSEVKETTDNVEWMKKIVLHDIKELWNWGNKVINTVLKWQYEYAMAGGGGETKNENV